MDTLPYTRAKYLNDFYTRPLFCTTSYRTRSINGTRRSTIGSIAQTLFVDRCAHVYSCRPRFSDEHNRFVYTNILFIYFLFFPTVWKATSDRACILHTCGVRSVELWSACTRIYHYYCYYMRVFTTCLTIKIDFLVTRPQ